MELASLNCVGLQMIAGDCNRRSGSVTMAPLIVVSAISITKLLVPGGN